MIEKIPYMEELRMAKILIVEDEEYINELIKENLSVVGHECEQVYDGIQAIERIQSRSYDLILLDVMLPKVNGYQVLDKVKETPVIMVTARDGILDKVKGLNQGAEDYIVKPFDMLELIARVNVALRRRKPSSQKVEFDHVVIDMDSKCVTLDGNQVELSPKEYELLEVFVINKNIALSRERLIEMVWGYCFDGENRTVDVHVVYLRKKLRLDHRIKTVYKLGYRLEL